ncbi:MULTISPECIES: DHCW motif cupin fold protein [unclassified Sphingomonas]|uniref:DHCW motif cupin fold protein n=1 Tax=unclassified Sphingomonas TaxID=196159 RepID=UPI0006F44999|nr:MULTISPECIES: DHCW motif cupin fold protein [unclassified Sphingomonas]KQX23414.1 hypothetical protein ASD17_03680 [Sphingomonas sp. Root1294]KQY68265.1 hypothetical protein ASD39_06200 [Sphingomonas sp. Root50]KRB91164.1 hypothetical protein ASE22_13005 [Sphingomonas sp. Root720]
MNIEACPFTVIAFETLEASHLPGDSGGADYRQKDAGDIRMRIADYSAGYVADHWCDIGHFGYVLSGTVTIELKDKPSVELKAGEAFLVSSFGDAAHRVCTDGPARLLLLD